jgi:serine/threonine protein kinase
MHEKGFRHGDLKCGNFLMDSSDRPVLADFGLSYEVLTVASNRLQRGTNGFRHPLKPTANCPKSIKDHFKYDIFQLGMTIVAVLLGRPFISTSSLEQFTNICRTRSSVADFVMVHTRSECPMHKHGLCENARFMRPQYEHIWTCLEAMLPASIEDADVNDMRHAMNELIV